MEKNSNVFNPLGSQVREYRSASESAGTQPEWSSAWSNTLCIRPDRLFDLTTFPSRSERSEFNLKCTVQKD
jgi:hypothetical protein